MDLSMFEPQAYDAAKGTLTLKTFTAVITGGESSVVSDPEGLSNWKPDANDIFWLVQFATTGQLDVSMHVANDDDTAGAELEVEIANRKLATTAPSTGGSKAFVRVTLGSVTIEEATKVKVALRIKSAKGQHAGSCSGLELGGPAAAGSTEVKVPRDVAPGILQMKEGVPYDMVYNAVTPTLSYMGTRFVAIAASDMDNLSLCDTDYEGEQSVRFSFDDGKHVCKLNVGDTYHFLVRVVPSPDGKSVDYSAYVHENSQWQRVGSYNGEVDPATLIQNPSCHVYGSGFQQGYFPREALYGPMWARTAGNQWEELSDATFRFCTEINANGNASVEDCRFRLRSGGDTRMTIEPRSVLSARKTGQLPDILKDIDAKLPR